MKFKQLMKVGSMIAVAAIALSVLSCASTGKAGATLKLGTYSVQDMPTSNPDVTLDLALTLSAENNFELTSRLSNSDMVTTEAGTYAWFDEGMTIIDLDLAEGSPLRLFRVVGNGLRHLQPDGEEFEEALWSNHTLVRE
ncbi:MAG: copper resistance protein NlpE [Treponema sp.]|nr:copper resistance protein NlpE [Treponema sp.]